MSSESSLAVSGGGLIPKTNELAPTAAAAREMAEIQAAVIMARQNPRDENLAYSKVMSAVGRPSFADEALYSFKRGNGEVEGPSVKLAREIARVWGNIRTGLDIIAMTKDKIRIRQWAWDLETNTKLALEDEFDRVIWRKKNGSLVAMEPQERDLRELIFRHGAILERNCLLKLFPEWLVADAQRKANETLVEDVKKNRSSSLTRILGAFKDLGVDQAELEKFLGHKLEECKDETVVELRKVYQSIRDGNSKWAEYVGEDGVSKRKSLFQAEEPKAPAQDNTAEGAE